VKPSLFAIYIREQLWAIVARYPIPLGRIRQDTLAVCISACISAGLCNIGIVVVVVDDVFIVIVVDDDVFIVIIMSPLWLALNLRRLRGTLCWQRFRDKGTSRSWRIDSNPHLTFLTVVVRGVENMSRSTRRGTH
jgi:hypothetical protein